MIDWSSMIEHVAGLIIGPVFLLMKAARFL